MAYSLYYASPLGGITLKSDGAALTGLWFDGQKYAADGSTAVDDGRRPAENLPPVLTETIRWLDLYFAGKDPGFTPQLAPGGSAFRRAVGEIMLTIPYGQTMTYGEIASQIANDMGAARMSAQAVGGAVGHNPIGIIIPCHRVVGAGGNLTGYAGGPGYTVLVSKKTQGGRKMKITKDMKITEVLSFHPAIANILMNKGMHCISCMAAAGESLEEALYVHGYGPADVDAVVDQLNDFLGEAEANA